MSFGGDDGLSGRGTRVPFWDESRDNCLNSELRDPFFPVWLDPSKSLSRPENDAIPSMLLDLFQI